MNAVPFMNKPKLEDILKYREKIPCFDKVESIMLEEIAKGNTILHIGDAGCWPSETVVVIDFTSEPKADYAGIKVKQFQNGHNYKYLTLSDNKGALEVDFGRVKE